jgi:predicted AAA+ superfamily ATPase
MYIKRKLEVNVKKALKQFPAVFITGPRQAGKSTLLRHTLSNYNYVNFDNPLVRSLAQKDPELFLQNNPTPLIIDEVQYVPELLSYLKIRIDANRRLMGQYVLTGSQSFQLMKGISETLAGRIAIFSLYPLSWIEINKLKNPLDDLTCAEQTIKGFYPEFFAQPNVDINLWYSSYLTTYLERDVRNLKNITDLSRFQTFLGLLATRAGQLLNLSEIAKECGITQPTVKDWLSVLEATYIIYLLKPYHINRTKRLVKSPKLYFVDTGLLCYLLGIDSSERLFKAAERGHIFENMVIMEAIKHLSHSVQRSQVYFYRTNNGVEVDLLIEKRGELFAYEIKFSKTIYIEMCKPLEQFLSDHEVKRAVLLSLSEKHLNLKSKILARHWSSISK